VKLSWLFVAEECLRIVCGNFFKCSRKAGRFQMANASHRKTKFYLYILVLSG
jgi:hypothetical protein